ncbi:MAG TPA: hypothetical protein VNL14_10630 [Candidatus Acidoferrales bacterium]|nr:hypothetical protein [Candidatus Acidoferrales bacterium]
MDAHVFKRFVPAAFKDRYARLWRGLAGAPKRRLCVTTIDLRRLLVGGEGIYDAASWAELTGDWQRASARLESSLYVEFLEQYRALGDGILEPKVFEKTAYFQNAARCIRFLGAYFGQREPGGIRAQARAFLELYERIRTGDAREVPFPSERDHTRPGNLPVVRETLTPQVYEIADGHHRLAAAWALGHRRRTVAVLRAPAPSGLQALVLKASPNGEKTLLQPIEAPEFDSSWKVLRSCRDGLSAMLAFLAEKNHRPADTSVLDLACAYGWFVKEFARRGFASLGVEADPAALHVGRVAYGLTAEQLVQSDFAAFAQKCARAFDVVVFLGRLREPPGAGAFDRLAESLRALERLTRSVLFFDVEGGSSPSARIDAIVRTVMKNTSFAHARRLGPSAGGVRDQPLLFACARR